MINTLYLLHYNSKIKDPSKEDVFLEVHDWDRFGVNGNNVNYCYYNNYYDHWNPLTLRFMINKSIEHLFAVLIVE